MTRRDPRDDGDRARDREIGFLRRLLLLSWLIIGTLALRWAFTEPSVLQMLQGLAP